MSLHLDDYGLPVNTPKDWTKREEQFAKFMGEVNSFLGRRFGVGADDLPDFCYRDWFEDDQTAIDTARAAYFEAGGE